jgi:hypothetical protein
MYELRDSGTTVLFVSHSTQAIEDFCTEALLLHEGRVMATGETTEVLGEYQALVASIKDSKKHQPREDGQSSYQAVVAKEERPEGPTFKKDPDFERRVAQGRGGTGEAKIQGVELLDKRNRPVQVVTSGAEVTVRVYLEYMQAVNDSELVLSIHDGPEPSRANRQESQFYGPNLGYAMELYERYRENPDSVDERTREFFETWSPSQVEANGHAPGVTGPRTKLFSASTALEAVPLKEMGKGERVVVDFTFTVPLRRGRYGISVGARTSGEDSFLDWVDIATSFQIKPPRDRRGPFLGLLHLPTEVRVHTPEGERQGPPV